MLDIRFPELMTYVTEVCIFLPISPYSDPSTTFHLCFWVWLFWISYLSETMANECFWLLLLRLVKWVQGLVAQMVKNLPAVQETWVWSLGWEDPLEKEMATHSSILAWRTPWTEEPGGLQTVGLQRVRHDWRTNIFTSSGSREACNQELNSHSWGRTLLSALSSELQGFPSGL